MSKTFTERVQPNIATAIVSTQQESGLAAHNGGRSNRTSTLSDLEYWTQFTETKRQENRQKAEKIVKELEELEKTQSELPRRHDDIHDKLDAGPPQEVRKQLMDQLGELPDLERTLAKRKRTLESELTFLKEDSQYWNALLGAENPGRRRSLNPQKQKGVNPDLPTLGEKARDTIDWLNKLSPEEQQVLNKELDQIDDWWNKLSPDQLQELNKAPGQINAEMFKERYLLQEYERTVEGSAKLEDKYLYYDKPVWDAKANEIIEAHGGKEIKETTQLLKDIMANVLKWLGIWNAELSAYLKTRERSEFQRSLGYSQYPPPDEKTIDLLMKLQAANDIIQKHSQSPKKPGDEPAFKITDEVLTSLQKSGVPSSVIDKLEHLKSASLQFIGKTEFLKALTSVLTKEEIENNKVLRISAARVNTRPNFAISNEGVVKPISEGGKTLWKKWNRMIDISRMDVWERIAEMLERATLVKDPKTGKTLLQEEIIVRIKELISTEGLAILGVGTGIWLAGHIFGVSQIVDVVLAIIGYSLPRVGRNSDN